MPRSDKETRLPRSEAEPRPTSIESRDSWVAAIAAVCILSLSYGAPLVAVVGLRTMAEDLGSSRALPALASSLAYLGSGAGGVAMGLLVPRFGMRLVATFGGACIGLGLLLAAGGAAWQLLLGYGLLVGFFGTGALFAPLMTHVSMWFDRRRGSAVALVSSGQYVAAVLWPSLFERGIAFWGWQATMLAFGVVSAALIMPVALLVLKPPPASTEPPPTAASRAAESRVLGLPPNLVQACFCAAVFLCCIPMAMPAAHLVAFCGDIGIPASRGALMLSVTMLCAFLARQAWGALGDRIGGLNTALAGNVLQTIGMCLFLATQDEAGLFLVAALYGLGFGGIVPSYVLGIRALFPARQAHWRVPVLIFCGLTGMATGSWLAGVIYDSTGSYATAWQVGILANLVNLAVLVPLAWRWRGWRGPRPALA